MKLESLAYTEFPGQAGEWRFESFSLGQINLVVGRNAVGKTRLLNVINSLARLMSGLQQETTFSGKFQAVFKDGGESWEYRLEYDPGEIRQETLRHNEKVVIERKTGGMGRIDTAIETDGEKEKMALVRFQALPKQPAISAKRDPLQHPYLEPLVDWSLALRHFQFGAEMRPHTLAIAVKGAKIEIDEKNTGSPVPIFDLALRTHGEELKRIVIGDMRRLGYHITDMRIRKPDYTVIQGFIPGELAGVAVKENGLGVMTDQPNMSQGMFRALSLLIQTTHYMLSNKAGCILVDDIGEGLDFERSCTLIDILRDKAQRSSFQLIMSTNDRFVMNAVPLEEWYVLQRKGGQVLVRNYENSKENFDEFKFTGLSNFDFFATDFLDKEPEEAVARE
jgi:energy-coupling factor transporter ATP-binding protein EcfA2